MGQAVARRSRGAGQDQVPRGRWRAYLQTAKSGRGVLVQRDYWAVVKNCRLRPSEIVTLIRHQFEDFPPPTLCIFTRDRTGNEPLEMGDRLSVRIRMAGDFAVCVTNVDAQSITLGTLKGHPEAGRITFGAYRNRTGDVIFHIRSLARSSSWRNYAGFLTAGDPMQTYTWTDFVDNLAHTAGDGVHGMIHAEMHIIRRGHGDDPLDIPTYLARGD